MELLFSQVNVKQPDANQKIPCNYHHSFLVPAVLLVSQRLNLAASKSEGNIPKKMKFH